MTVSWSQPALSLYVASLPHSSFLPLRAEQRHQRFILGLTQLPLSNLSLSLGRLFKQDLNSKRCLLRSRL